MAARIEYVWVKCRCDHVEDRVGGLKRILEGLKGPVVRHMGHGWTGKGLVIAEDATACRVNHSPPI